MYANNQDSLIQRPRGQLTTKMARAISQYWEPRGYYVLYDHDPSSHNMGKIVSSFGEQPPRRSTQLSHVDIALVERDSERVFALIEIEEATDKPKTLLGAVFGILMGEHLSFGKDHPLMVDENTGIFVFGKSKFSHADRLDYMLDKIRRFSSDLGTGNSKIRKIDIRTFSTDAELKELLTDHIEAFHTR